MFTTVAGILAGYVSRRMSAGASGSNGRSQMHSNQKISPEVTERAEGPAGGEGEIPVIVTLAPRADPAVLESRGLAIRRVMDNIPAVAGTVTGTKVSELAQLDEVERIEFDGEMYAL